MLKVGGICVSPFEVEEALQRAPAVLEAAVIGREDRDGLIKPKAFVILRDGRPADTLVAELQAHVGRTDRRAGIPALDRVRRQPAEDGDRQDPAFPAAGNLTRPGRSPSMAACWKPPGGVRRGRCSDPCAAARGLGSVRLWRDLPERLAAATGWNVFAYSRFGYGYSDPVPLPRPLTYMHHEAQVVLPQVLRLAGIDDAVLIGHSDGGSIAAIYAGAAGLGSSAGGSAVRLRGLVTIAAHFTVEDININSIRQIRHDYETGSFRDRLGTPSPRRRGRVPRLERRVAGPAKSEHSINRGSWLQYQVPVLALQGEDDPYGTTEQLRILQASVSRPGHHPCLSPVRRHSASIWRLRGRDAGPLVKTDFIAELSREAPKA